MSEPRVDDRREERKEGRRGGRVGSEGDEEVFVVGGGWGEEGGCEGEGRVKVGDRE